MLYLAVHFKEKSVAKQLNRVRWRKIQSPGRCRKFWFKMPLIVRGPGNCQVEDSRKILKEIEENEI